MQYKLIIKILGLLLSLFSFSMLVPVAVALWYAEPTIVFIESFLLTFFTGLILYLPFLSHHRELRIRDGFLIVVLFWSVLSLFGAIPFYFHNWISLSFVDAVFESTSGLTTTGATIISNIDILPKSILYYRQQLQWLGGMGIIVLAVAVLPMLGIGGMQLYKAETPGPIKDNKLTPRITETAKALWYIYMLLTITCALAYWFAGMSVFDAISHSFSTISIGGFSTHNQSIGFYDSSLIEMIAVFFMLLSGMNFALHFTVWHKLNFKLYFNDSEFKAFFVILFIVALICFLYLFFNGKFDASESLTAAIFQAVSIGTTAGFTTHNYAIWPGFLPILLIFASFVGGCAGSTGGGLKVIRVLLLIKQGRRELQRLIHPNAKIYVKLGGRAVGNKVMDAVWGFFATYVAVFVLLMLMFSATGLDQVSSFAAVAATINNLGPGLGEVANNFRGLTDFAKWISTMSMMLGRLEIFTILILLTPAFWRG
ncbi:MAG: potassium transporter [Gammaproteobacteria bacterium]|nr:MAG: potassium transporter [Gammaproteobacteria bacterium]